MLGNYCGISAHIQFLARMMNMGIDMKANQGVTKGGQISQHTVATHVKTVSAMLMALEVGNKIDEQWRHDERASIKGFIEDGIPNWQEILRKGYSKEH